MNCGRSAGEAYALRRMPQRADAMKLREAFAVYESGSRCRKEGVAVFQREKEIKDLRRNITNVCVIITPEIRTAIGPEREERHVEEKMAVAVPADAAGTDPADRRGALLRGKELLKEGGIYRPRGYRGQGF